MQHGEDHVGGLVEAGQVGGGDVAGEHVVAHRLQPVDDGLAADEADFAFGAGAAVENGDFHGVQSSGSGVQKQDVKFRARVCLP